MCRIHLSSLDADPFLREEYSTTYHLTRRLVVLQNSTFQILSGSACWTLTGFMVLELANGSIYHPLFFKCPPDAINITTYLWTPPGGTGEGVSRDGMCDEIFENFGAFASHFLLELRYGRYTYGRNLDCTATGTLSRKYNRVVVLLRVNSWDTKDERGRLQLERCSTKTTQS